MIVKCYFSPCGNVRRTVDTLGDELIKRTGLKERVIDFTLKQKRQQSYRFSKEDIVIVGVPVYAGRIPNLIMPFIKECIKGGGALGVPMVCYGNRSFDNALAELAVLMKENDFQIAGAAAVVSEHSFVPELAAGRPNQEDLEQIRRYAEKILDGMEKIENVIAIIPGDPKADSYYIPLKEDKTPAKFLKATPQIDRQRCNSCGHCVSLCPMNSIDANSFEVTGICIKCQACIKGCAKEARYFEQEDFLSHKKMLKECYNDRKESFFAEI